MNLKVYEIINSLNKRFDNTFGLISWEEKKYDIETLSIDRVLNEEHLFKNYAENMHQKVVPDSFLFW